MTRHPNSVIIAVALFFVISIQSVQAQAVTLFYGNDQSIQNCRVVRVTQSVVILEAKSLIPGFNKKKSLPLASVIGVREFSRANRIAPYLAVLGSYLGVKYFMKEPKRQSEKTFGEKISTWLEPPINLIACITLGGGIGYFTAHYGLGGNSELIMLNSLTNTEKQKHLSIYVNTETRL